MIRWAVIACLMAGPVAAEMVVAARVVRPQTILSAADLALSDQQMAGTFSDFAGLIGQEAKVVLYPGRPILPEDVGPPALVDRNQIVPLVYTLNGLTIRLEGRALGRASVGESLRVMNLDSRNVVTGIVQQDSSVRVK